MRLRRLYTNRPEVRPLIEFRDGLNVIIGEIRLPENQDRDTHNLGKSLLAQLIDFCLLKNRSKDFFLFEHQDRFAGLTFFLEVETTPGSFVTIQRSVDEASKASFVVHGTPHQDFVDLDENDWTHWQLPFERAVQTLDGILALDAVSPWPFRKIIGYSLRTQRDYDEPFKLSKFGGKHAQWKPFLAHVIGLDAAPITRSYEIQEQIEALTAEEKRLTGEVAHVAESADQLRGRLRIREEALAGIEKTVEAYDFDVADADINQELVDRIDAETATLNERRYYVTSHLERINAAQRERVTVNFGMIKKVFEQAKIFFPDALAKQYLDLEKFSKAISAEREEYLEEERRQLTDELVDVRKKLATLNRERARALAALSDRETFSKFRKLSSRLVEQRTEVEVLREKAQLFEQLAAKRKKLRDLQKEKEDLKEQIELGIAGADGTYLDVRTYFNEIIEEVIDRKASLYTDLNNEGNVEFHTEILDAAGHETSAGDGNTYSRLLCMAFDLAVARARLGDAFPHFLYHDGALETLDHRKKINLLRVFREYAVLGVQIIITVIDSELPPMEEDLPVFSNDEIVLLLHDDGQDGRLFRMPTW